LKRNAADGLFTKPSGYLQHTGGKENMSPAAKKSSRPLTGLEALGKAIRSEAEAYRFYTQAMKKTSNPILREKLSKLAGEEKRHRQILETRYLKSTGEERAPLPPPSGPEGKGPAPKDLKPEEILTIAIQMEREAAQFYQREARKSSDMSARFMLEYLADFERGHEKALETELKALKRFPNWFSLEDPVVMLVG
jgi:rubrerythrin